MTPSPPQRPPPSPYANFHFRVVLDGSCVMGVSKVSAISRPGEVVYGRGGFGPPWRVTPDPAPPEPIVLKRGVSYDPAFQQWASRLSDRRDLRRDLLLEVYDEAGGKVFAYVIFRAWVSALDASSEQDGSGAAMVVTSMTLQNDGWMRDGPDPPVPEVP